MILYGENDKLTAKERGTGNRVLKEIIQTDSWVSSPNGVMDGDSTPQGLYLAISSKYYQSEALLIPLCLQFVLKFGNKA